MPFARPELEEIHERVVADIETRIPGADARLPRRSILGVLAAVFSESVHSLYGFLGWVSRQVFPDSAELEYLNRWAAIWGIRRKAATAARATVRFTGAEGTIITAAVLLQRSDGTEYLTQHEAVVAGGLADVVVEARTAGAAPSLVAAGKLALVSPIPGLDPEGTVQAGAVDGAEEESDQALRERLLARIQEPPHGGAAFDYITWALEVPGVTDAWVFPLEFGIGTVGVTFVRRGDGAGAAVLPDAAEVAEVQAYIAARRPVTAAVTVYAPTDAPDDFTIHVAPDTPSVRAAVQAELEDLYLREAKPGATMLISKIREAVSRAAGESDNEVVSPPANVPHASQAMPRVGTITWA